MAEELDIRSIWQKSKAFEQPASVDIDRLEKTKTKTTLYWIKFILRIEFWLNIVVFPFYIHYTYNVRNDTTFTIIYAGIALVYAFYYLFLIKQIKGFSYDGDVVQSLRKVYGYLNFYLLHYKVVIWLSLVVGLIIGYNDDKKSGEISADLTQQEWLIMIGTTIIFALVIGAILHFLIHLIYGRKIKRLKQIVNSLEKDE